MFDYDEGLSAAIGRRRTAEAGTWPFPGRHESHDEIADETPIFHALTVGGWRSRRGGSGRSVRSVHRPTVRRGRIAPSRSAEATAGVTADSLAGFHTASEVPQQTERRRDADRAADRAAIMDLLGGAGRHRLGAPA